MSPVPMHEKADLNVFRSTSNDLVERRFRNSTHYETEKRKAGTAQPATLAEENARNEIYLAIMNETKQQELGEKISGILTKIFGNPVNKEFKMKDLSPADKTYLRNFFSVVTEILRSSSYYDIHTLDIFLLEFNIEDIKKLYELAINEKIGNEFLKGSFRAVLIIKR